MATLNFHHGCSMGADVARSDSWRKHGLWSRVLCAYYPCVNGPRVHGPPEDASIQNDSRVHGSVNRPCVCDVFSPERGWSRQDEVWWLTFASCHRWFQLPSLLWHYLFGNSNGIHKTCTNVLFRGCSRSYCNSDKRPAKQKLIALSNIGSKDIKILLDMDSSVSDMQTAGHSITTHHGELQAATSLGSVPAWRWLYIGPVVVGNVGDNSVSSYRLHVSETQQLADATPIRYLCGVARGQPSTNDGPTCNTP